jgi:hypothetical protein
LSIKISIKIKFEIKFAFDADHVMRKRCGSQFVSFIAIKSSISIGPSSFAFPLMNSTANIANKVLSDPFATTSTTNNLFNQPSHPTNYGVQQKAASSADFNFPQLVQPPSAGNLVQRTGNNRTGGNAMDLDALFNGLGTAQSSGSGIPPALSQPPPMLAKNAAPAGMDLSQFDRLVSFPNSSGGRTNNSGGKKENGYKDPFDGLLN